jgi:hypothetical protein
VFGAVDDLAALCGVSGFFDETLVAFSNETLNPSSGPYDHLVS